MLQEALMAAEISFKNIKRHDVQVSNLDLKKTYILIYITISVKKKKRILNQLGLNRSVSLYIAIT